MRLEAGSQLADQALRSGVLFRASFHFSDFLTCCH
jgi:hypothetical protein